MSQNVPSYSILLLKDDTDKMIYWTHHHPLTLLLFGEGNEALFSGVTHVQKAMAKSNLWRWMLGWSILEQSPRWRGFPYAEKKLVSSLYLQLNLIIKHFYVCIYFHKFLESFSYHRRNQTVSSRIMKHSGISKAKGLHVYLW